MYSPETTPNRIEQICSYLGNPDYLTRINPPGDVKKALEVIRTLGNVPPEQRDAAWNAEWLVASMQAMDHYEPIE